MYDLARVVGAEAERGGGAAAVGVERRELIEPRDGSVARNERGS